MRSILTFLFVASFVVVASAACSSTSDGGGSTTSSGAPAASSSSSTSSTSSSSGGSAAEGKAACYAACDAYMAAKCPNTPANYGEACRTVCDAAYMKAPPECQDERAAFDVCARDKITYGCSASGIVQISPIGGCGQEGVACIKCSPKAGGLCFGPDISH
jgi:hypothetical protein